MENVMVSVPLNDFVDGVVAKADLDSIKAVLGIPVEKAGNDGTD